MSTNDDEVELAEARRALASPGWCHVLDGAEVDARRIFEGLGRVTRRVRGRKMRDWPAVYDEFAAAWQFGNYFGENAMAFEECLGDLDDTWPTTSGFVVVVSEPEKVLIGDSPSSSGSFTHWLGGLVAMFDETQQWYAESVDGPPGDVNARAALSFDVVLETYAEHRDEVVRRWRAAGAPLD